MFKEPFEIIALKKHTDNRGSLFEILRFLDSSIPGEGQLYCYTVNPQFRRGDHYHEKKREWIICVSGIVFALLQDKQGNKKKVLLNGDEPTLIYCDPGTTHAILNESDSPAVMISYSSTQHTSENPDTISNLISL